MSLAVVSFPQMSEAAHEWIATLHQQYPALEREPIDPHFTLVYPTGNLGAEALIHHTEAVASNFALVPFAVRCVLLMPDTHRALTYLYLTPDEGLSDLVLLHDALYSGPLAPELDLSRPFVPHMTLGFSDDVLYAKEVCDMVNSYAFEVEGMVTALDVLSVDDQIESVARITL